MKNFFFRAVLLLIAALFCCCFSYSQCSTSAPAVGACSGGNGAVPTSNANINSGITYWYSGSSGTISGVNLNGGTLRVCGTLNISSINFNSGSLIVESGGSLTMNGFNMNGNSSITNRGTVKINGSLVMQNNNNTIWNNSVTSSFTITGSLTINSGSNNIYNKGNIAINGTLSIQGGGICLEDNAIINTAILNNTSGNNLVTWNGSSLPGCIGVSSSAQVGSHTLTSSTHINVCLSSGFSYTSGNASNWGSAVVSSNCAGCNIILPINDIQLSGSFQNNAVSLSWSQKGSISAEDIFYVEESDDGINFHSIATVVANTNKSEYSLSDYEIAADAQYYRIRQTDGYGASNYSNIIVVKTGSVASLIVYPNPVLSSVNIQIQSDVQEKMNLTITDISGREFDTKQINLTAGKNKFSWQVKQMPSGTYVLKLQSASKGNIIRLISVVRQ